MLSSRRPSRDDGRLTWSRKQGLSTLAEAINSGRQKLPVIIRVVDGYQGPDDIHPLRSGDVLLVHGVKKQKRVLLCDMDNRRLSVPLTYPARFQVVSSAGTLGEPRTMEEILSRPGLPPRAQGRINSFEGKVVRFEHDNIISYTVGDNRYEEQHFGDMTVLDSYEESYICCCSIELQGSTDQAEPFLLPSFLPPTYEAAVGMLGCDKGTWDLVLQTYNEELGRVALDAYDIQTCTDLVLLPNGLASGGEVKAKFVKASIGRKGKVEPLVKKTSQLKAAKKQRRPPPPPLPDTMDDTVGTPINPSNQTPAQKKLVEELKQSLNIFCRQRAGGSSGSGSVQSSDAGMAQPHISGSFTRNQENLQTKNKSQMPEYDEMSDEEYYTENDIRHATDRQNVPAHVVSPPAFNSPVTYAKPASKPGPQAPRIPPVPPVGHTMKAAQNQWQKQEQHQQNPQQFQQPHQQHHQKQSQHEHQPQQKLSVKSIAAALDVTNRQKAGGTADDDDIYADTLLPEEADQDSDEDEDDYTEPSNFSPGLTNQRSGHMTNPVAQPIKVPPDVRAKSAKVLGFTAQKNQGIGRSQSFPKLDQKHRLQQPNRVQSALFERDHDNAGDEHEGGDIYEEIDAIHLEASNDASGDQLQRHPSIEEEDEIYGTSWTCSEGPKRSASVPVGRVPPRIQRQSGTSYHGDNTVNIKATPGFSPDQFPQDISTYTIRMMSDALKFINLGKYSAIFEEKQINGPLLQALPKESLVSDVGMNNLEATKLEMFVNGWRPA